MDYSERLEGEREALFSLIDQSRLDDHATDPGES